MDEKRDEMRAAGHDPTLQMTEHRESIEYQWEWVTASMIISRGPCELVSVFLVPSAATTNSAIYDGVDTQGKLIGTLVAAVAAPWQFSARVPLYCRQGLYVVVGDNVTGILVQWRELGRRGPGGAWA